MPPSSGGAGYSADEIDAPPGVRFRRVMPQRATVLPNSAARIAAATERLMLEGAAALSDAELLASALDAAGTEGPPPEHVAARLLEHFGSLRAVFAAGPVEIRDASGLDAEPGAMIPAISEIARRLSSEPLERTTRVDSSSVVHSHFGPLLSSEKRESFHVLLLDSKNRLMAKTRISQGSLGASLVHPREAFRPAVLAAAAAVIFVHNHPSGDPSPSREDHEVTGRLREAGTLMGIPVLDHVVIARRGYYSFADHGWS